MKITKIIFKNFDHLLKKSYIVGITGSPGVGKSTILGKIAKKIMESKTLGAPLSGQIKKIGRNEPCPCGSGKKYKNCCMH